MARGSFRPFTLLYNEGSLSLINVWAFEEDTSILDKSLIASESPILTSHNSSNQAIKTSHGNRRSRPYGPRTVFPLCPACHRFGHYEVECKESSAVQRMKGSAKSQKGATTTELQVQHCEANADVTPSRKSQNNTIQAQQDT